MDLVAASRSFVDRALVRPAPDIETLTPQQRRRAQLVCAGAIVVGGVLLGFAISADAGSDLFYPLTLAVAVVWTVAGVTGSRPRLGWTTTAGTGGRPPRRVRPIAQALIIGLVLLAIFLVGATVVAQLPALRGPVDDLLDHARFGSLSAVLAVTVVSGIAEELFFRGALYDALPDRFAVIGSTALYGLVTVGTGVPLLVLASLVLGSVTALQRRATGGLLAPIITHVVWSSGMLLLLPPVLDQL